MHYYNKHNDKLYSLKKTVQNIEFNKRIQYYLKCINYYKYLRYNFLCVTSDTLINIIILNYT